jgi:hypothetical protein
LDQNTQPEMTDQQTVIVVEKEPTLNDPVISFSLYEVTELEYPQRVKVERTIQKYRPKWGFLALGVAGAAFALVAANSTILLPSVSTSQRVMLNISGGVLGALSFINMQPTGDPIFTGESELIRKSGIEVVRDSVRNLSATDIVADLLVTYDGNELFAQNDLRFTQSALDINLASLEPQLRDIVNKESEINISIRYNGFYKELTVPVVQFLAPFINITDPIALLRNSPSAGSAENIISEVGKGSLVEILGDEPGDWYRIRYQQEEAFIEKSSGEIEWKATVDSGSLLIFEFAELPFGEIDVENSVPILKPNNPSDRALILSNGIDNGLGVRQYLDRDHQLFRHYMRTALQLQSDQIFDFQEAGNNQLSDFATEFEGMGQNGSLMVYLTGFATIKEVEGSSEIVLISENDQDVRQETLLRNILAEFEYIEPEALFLFVDLEYIDVGNGNGNSEGMLRNGNNSLLNRITSDVLLRIPNSAVLFSNRPGQKSGIYTGMIDGNKRHNIFNYFWAEALKQRMTRMSDLIRHLDNNVDYTSRRLHDRPQEVQAFGNLTLDLAR